MSFSLKRFRGGVHPWEGKELTESKSVKTAPLLDKYFVLSLTGDFKRMLGI